MARSFKRAPVVGMTTACSDKPWKVAEHRRERAHLRTRLASAPDAETGQDRLRHPKGFGNPWRAPKDGKQWWHSEEARRK